MKNLFLVSALACAAVSFPALSDGGLKVVNLDDSAYTLVLEDTNEKSWEVTIAPGETLSDVCSECYVWIKGNDAYEYGDANTVLKIVKGALTVEDHE